MNPMGLNGPGWGGNYIQSNSGNPASNPAVASYAVGDNPLGLTWPLPTYTQPNYATTPAPQPAFPMGN